MGKRVVITGLGIVSCLGNDAGTVTRSLYDGRSGISKRQEQIDMGMRSHVAGAPEIDIPSLVDHFIDKFNKRNNMFIDLLFPSII